MLVLFIEARIRQNEGEGCVGPSGRQPMPNFMRWYVPRLGKLILVQPSISLL